ncbi:MAG: hypothetical protein V4536_08760 [Pseudomonadota bacterium]
MSVSDTLKGLLALGLPIDSIGLAKAAASSMLNADSKINPIFLPNLSAIDTFVVPDEQAMLGIQAKGVSLAVRLDGGCFILLAMPATTRSNWIQMAVPTDVVSSFLGRKGDVFPTAGDYTSDQIALPSSLSSLGATVSDALIAVFRASTGGGAGGSASTGSTGSGGSTGSSSSSGSAGSTGSSGSKYPAFLPFIKNITSLKANFVPFTAFSKL